MHNKPINVLSITNYLELPPPNYSAIYFLINIISYSLVSKIIYLLFYNFTTYYLLVLYFPLYINKYILYLY